MVRYVRIINYSEIGIMFTNLAIIWGAQIVEKMGKSMGVVEENMRIRWENYSCFLFEMWKDQWKSLQCPE